MDIVCFFTVSFCDILGLSYIGIFVLSIFIFILYLGAGMNADHFHSLKINLHIPHVSLCFHFINLIKRYFRNHTKCQFSFCKLLALSRQIYILPGTMQNSV